MCFIASTTCVFCIFMYIYYMQIQPFMSSLWQESWDEMDSKLRHIISHIDGKYNPRCTSRQDEVIVNRLRRALKRLTHSVRLEKRPLSPFCNQCKGNHELTVKNILLEYDFPTTICRKHYHMPDLKQPLHAVPSKRVVDLVKVMAFMIACKYCYMYMWGLYMQKRVGERGWR